MVLHRKYGIACIVFVVCLAAAVLSMPGMLSSLFENKPESFSSGGGKAVSSNYTHEASIGISGGTASSTAYTAQAGFLVPGIINAVPQITRIVDFAFLNDETFAIDLDSCVTDDQQPSEMIWQVTPADTVLKADFDGHVVDFSAPRWADTTDVKFKVIDPAGASDSVTVTAIVTWPADIGEVADQLPKTYELEQNYPNPFNPQTTISYALPKASNVTVTVFNMRGQRIAELVHGKKEAGYHTVVWEAGTNPSGTYIIRMRAGDTIKIKKCLLLK